MSAEVQEPERNDIAVFPAVEPYVTETGVQVREQLRVAHTSGVGFSLELGPYEFTRRDVDLLAMAVQEFQTAERQAGILRGAP